jgi:cytochrome c oxidase subunit 6a
MSFAKHIEEETHQATAATGTWKNISFFVAIPAVIFCSYNAYVKEKEHAKHAEEHGKHFLPWPHLRIRSKPFPWGDGNHSLFHNPHTNALPEGYEDEH